MWLQAGVLAGIVGTLLLRTQVHPGTLDGGLLYMGSLFLTVLYITFSTLMELTFTVRHRVSTYACLKGSFAWSC